MMLDNPSDECFAKYYAEFGTTKEQVDMDTRLLKNWYHEQPHLPQVFQSDSIFRSLLLRCKFSVERSKHVLDLHFTIKSALPEYFTNRDPMSPELQKQMDIFEFVTLPRVTKEGYRVYFCKPRTPDSHFSEVALEKLIFMMADNRIANSVDLAVGEVYIVDLTELSLSHVTSLSIAQLRKSEICLSHGYRARVTSAHFINAPPVIEMWLPLMLAATRNKKLKSRIMVHTTLDSLYEHIDREVLPEDYGGKERKLGELWADWRKELESRRGWFMDQETMRVDESKRPGKTFDKNELFGIEGTFKQLTVD